MSGVDINQGEFVVRLGGDWRQVPSADPHQVSLTSEEKKSHVVISAVMANIPRGRLLEGAQVMAKARRDGELHVRQGRNVTFGDECVELKEGGEIGHVAYAGYDDQTIFRFMGWTTQRKMLSFWVSTETRDNDASKAVFDEVFKGFQFYIP
jgi:hypothetical protein